MMRRLRPIALLSLVGALVGMSLLTQMPAPAQAQVEITLWHSWQPPADQALRAWIASYPAGQAGRAVVRAEYVPFFEIPERLPTAAAKPDIVLGPSDWADRLWQAGLLTTLDLKLDDAYRATLSPLALRLATYGGRIVAVPLALEGIALYYNKAIVGARALPRTWDDLLAESRFHSQGERLGLLLMRDFYFTAGLYFALGGQLMDESGGNRLGQGDALLKYLTLLADLRTRAERGELALDPSSAPFREGKAAYLLTGSWALPTLQAALGDDLGALPLPMVNGQAWRSLARAEQLYIVKGSPDVDAALDFARHATSAQAQTAAAQVGLLPVNPAAHDPASLAGQIAGRLAADGIPIPARPEMRTYWVVMRQAIWAVSLDGRAPDEVAAETIRKVDEALAAGR